MSKKEIIQGIVEIGSHHIKNSEKARIQDVLNIAKSEIKKIDTSNKGNDHDKHK